MTEAIDDCTEAINLDGSYLKAYIKRGKWYDGLKLTKIISLVSNQPSLF